MIDGPIEGDVAGLCCKADKDSPASIQGSQPLPYGKAATLTLSTQLLDERIVPTGIEKDDCGIFLGRHGGDNVLQALSLQSQVGGTLKGGINRQ